MCHWYYLSFSDDPDAVEEIASLPEQARYGVNRVVDAIRPAVKYGSHLCSPIRGAFQTAEGQRATTCLHIVNIKHTHFDHILVVCENE